MKRCPITYEIISDQEDYSQRGLRSLSPLLLRLHPLDLNMHELRQEAIERAGKMSVQGVQRKLSAQLKISEERFAIVDQKGHYILKPQSESYPELPENEAITMTLAASIKLEVPVHGLIYGKDKSLTYFIKRFDRTGRNKKLALEDFAQLSGEDRHTKYNSSMEKVINIINQFCTFPKIEFVKFFKLTLFNFLIGNEDMHLKNFSLITRENKIMLSPAYDLLNTTILLKNTKEEIALPLNGKKNNLSKSDLFDYLATEKLQLNQNIINAVFKEIEIAIPQWKEMIGHSFLSENMQKKYLQLLEKRWQSIKS